MPDDWKESLPESIRSAPELSDVADIGSLATNFVTLKKTGTDWSASLPDELKSDPSLAPLKGKGIADVVKSYVNAQRMVGKDKVALPGEKATPEELNEFFKKLGRPDKPEDYKIAKPTDLPEGFPFQEKLVQDFTKTAHELGMTSKQAMGLYKWFMGAEVDAFTGMQKDAETQTIEAEKALRKEFGKAYDERLAGANMVLEKYAPEGLVDLLTSTGLGRNPLMVKFLASVANEFSEDTLKGMGSKRFGILSPADAAAELETQKMDKNFMAAYMNPKDSGHAAAVQKRTALYEAAHPEEQKA
jgi:hypothetical protein